MHLLSHAVPQQNESVAHTHVSHAQPWQPAPKPDRTMQPAFQLFASQSCEQFFAVSPGWHAPSPHVATGWPQPFCLMQLPSDP